MITDDKVKKEFVSLSEMHSKSSRDFFTSPKSPHESSPHSESTHLFDDTDVSDIINIIILNYTII